MCLVCRRGAAWEREQSVATITNIVEGCLLRRVRISADLPLPAGSV